MKNLQPEAPHLRELHMSPVPKRLPKRQTEAQRTPCDHRTITPVVIIGGTVEFRAREEDE